MELTRLIEHPELMDKETLYDLRSLLALHPYYQTARLLMLQNLFLLHDSSFDAELRKGAIYITDRAMLFNLVEAAHYQLRTEKPEAKGIPQDAPLVGQEEAPQENRTISLINDFLESIPKEETDDTVQKRKPTPADAAVDYVSYLLETEQEEKQTSGTPQMKGQSLIDDFIQKEGGKIQLKEEISYKPEEEALAHEEENETDEEKIQRHVLPAVVNGK